MEITKKHMRVKPVPQAIGTLPTKPFKVPTLIFLTDTFAKLLTDSQIIAVHTNLLAIE